MDQNGFHERSERRGSRRDVNRGVVQPHQSNSRLRLALAAIAKSSACF